MDSQCLESDNMSEQNKSLPQLSLEKMEALECPFTWGFDDVVAHNSEYKSHDDEELIPLVKLMRKLVKLYETSKNIGPAFERDGKEMLNELDRDVLSFAGTVNSDPNISLDVIHHIVGATSVFFLAKIGLTAEMEKNLSNAKIIDISDKIARNTLIGCKGICWEIYARADPDKAEKFIEDAINGNPNYHLWHFLHGKILRNKRRDFNFWDFPCEKEENSFKEAYSLCRNPVYGLFLGQMFREKDLKREASRLYEEVLQQSPESTVVLLRLALGFMNLKEMKKAKNCLDKASESSERNSMLLHYRGIYYLKMQQYGTAAKLLKDAAQDDNLWAEYTYIECMLKIDWRFDVLRHLLGMMEKYRHLPEKQIQKIVIDIAVLFWKRNKNIDESLEYFLKALRIDSRSKVLTDYFPSQIGLRLQDKNIFRMIEKEFLPCVYKENSSREIIEKANTLKQYCTEHQAT